ncbi:MAG: transcription initiation protein [Chloroflexi bacterium]|nr:transcription initiation protein [Chloroflexota bacterium]MBV9598123.1 transcription initiation protein [Chloroflexota bacterium]
MKYLMLICGSEDRLNDEQRMPAWAEYSNELASAGKIRGGERLRPAATATTLRLTGSERLLSDGPFTETKEQVGGFFVVEANNLDEAVDLASKMPHLQDGGAVEIRPVWDMN